MPSTPTLPYVPPSLKGRPGIDSPTLRGFQKAPGALYKQYDFLFLDTVGTILTPNPTGSTLGTVAGPLASAITLGTSASSGAPGGSYYFILTYTATSNESQTSQEILFNVAPGFVPTVSVASAGAPAGSTNFAAYVSLVPGMEALQQATRTTTALGATFTVANPLTNFQGVAQAATNQSANIVGLALAGSAANYLPYPGGSVLSGSNSSILGVAGNPPPMMQTDAGLTPVARLASGDPFLISLKQAWYPILAGTTAGLLLDATSGYFVADNSQSNKIITINGLAQGVDTSQSIGVNVPPYGVQGMLVEAYFNSGTI